MVDGTLTRELIDSLVGRLGSFGAYSMDEDGNLSDFHPNPMTAAAAHVITVLLAALPDDHPLHATGT